MRDQLNSSGSLSIQLMSNSMAPILPTGAIAFIAPAKFDELSMRDIVVFWSDGILICHCFWELSKFPAANGERTIVTRGLSSVGFDYPVRESEFLGRVT
ncbi:MAG: hypothetical protein V4692_05770, partial [Bdellovibrionota bacterium]